MKTILPYLRPKLAAISLGFFIKLVGTIAELLLPWMLSVILDDYVPAGNMRMIWLWGGMMVLAGALALLFNVVANRLATATSKDITQRLRNDLFSRVLRLSATQEDSFTTPSLISRLTSDTYNLHQMLDRMQRLGVRAPIMLLGGILITTLMEPVLALVLISTLPLLALVVWLISRQGVRLYAKTQTALDGMVRQAQESMAGVRVIQALSKADYEIGRFEEANRNFSRWEQRADLLMNLSSPIINLLLNVGLAAVIVVGAFRVDAGVTQPGVVIAYLSYFTIILNALMMVSRLFVIYSKGAASAQRIAQVLELAQEMETVPLPRVETGDFLRFEGVSFSYNKVDDNLWDISFSLQKGGTLGIIGATGSGKSTLLRLLLRFYDPDRGRILLDGRDLRSIPPQELYTKFGVVFQNDFLFSDTLGENIDFARHLPTQRLKAAIHTAQADFIHQREGGLEALLSEAGANLSGGQKQRLLLARAMAGSPELLLLDDSSSALDYKTDAELRQALSRDFVGTTKVIVAQRVSSIRHADQILMLEEGRMLGCGTHAQLLESCPAYAEIAHIQMGEVE